MSFWTEKDSWRRLRNHMNNAEGEKTFRNNNQLLNFAIFLFRKKSEKSPNDTMLVGAANKKTSLAKVSLNSIIRMMQFHCLFAEKRRNCNSKLLFFRNDFLFIFLKVKNQFSLEMPRKTFNLPASTDRNHYNERQQKKLDKHLRNVHVFRLWLCGSKMRVKMYRNAAN